MLRNSWGARGVALGLMLMGGSLLAPGVRAAGPVEKSLPETTVFFVEVEDASKMGAALEASQMGKLFADPALDPIKQDIKAKLSDGGKQFQAKLGLSITEALTLPQGPVSLAVVPATGGPQPIAVLVTADAGKNGPKMADLMARLTTLAKEDGDTKVETQTFKDLTLTSIQPAAKGDNKPPTITWVQQGTVFVIGTSVDAVKDLLSHADGREDALAGEKNFQAVQRKLGKDGQMLWFLNLERLVKLVTKAMEDQGAAQPIEAQLQLTGLNSLKAIGGRIGFNVGEYDQLVKTYIHAPGEPAGLLKLFPMPAVDLAPQPWVPGTVASYQTMSWDLDKTYTAITELADTFAPGALANFEQNLAGPKGEGLSFQKDIFGPLGDRITVLSDFKKPVTEDSQRMLIAVALEDAKAFQNTVSKVMAMANASPKKREFQGVTIYDFDLPEMPAGAAGTPFKGAISMAIAKDQMFVSSDPSFLEQILRGGGASLADNPAYKEAAKHFPAKSSTQSFQRPDEAARVLYDMFKSGRFKEAIEQGARNAGNNAQVPDLIDPKKLPEFSVFAKYLTQGGGFGQRDDEGMTFTSFSVKKANP